MAGLGNVVAVVQARMGSTRLPGKVFRNLAGRSMLEWVVLRLARAKRISSIVVATTDGPRDNPIAELARRLGAGVFRGSESDVLARYAGAAKATRADLVVRVTADCPLVDPALADEMLSAFGKAGPWDHYSNVVERTYPRGLDLEIVPARALVRAQREAKAPQEREHVTPYLYLHPELFRVGHHRDASDRSALRWTVDTEEDFRFMEALFAQMPDPAAASWREALAALERRPEIATINAGVAQKPLAPQEGRP